MLEVKPISLKITAFGPYAKQTELNFKEDLKNQDIFVITGPTGAGKTTIFDAICYALYGETSGNKRKGEELRSDFAASSDNKTEVEFTFSVKDKVYCINRAPKQWVKKLRGDGLREMAASVELRELDSDRAPLTKDMDVRNEVQAILGLSVDQFRKIVMIPQGDFKEFLYANTASKEELLRKIFGTDFYKALQEQLVEQSKCLKAEVADTEKEIAAKLKVIKCDPSSMLYQMIAENKLLVPILEEVQVELEKLSQEQLTLHEQVIAVDQDLQVQMQKRQDGLLLNEKFKQKEEIDARFQMLMKSRESMNELGKRVEFSKKADELTKLENEVLKQQTLYKKEVSLHQAGVEKLADLEQRFIIVKKCFEGIEEWQATVSKLTDEMNQLQNYADSLKIIEERRFEQDRVQEVVTKMTASLEDKSKRLNEMIEVLKTLPSATEQQQLLKEACFKEELEMNQLKEQQGIVGQLLTRYERLLKNQANYQYTMNQLTKSQGLLDSLKADYEHQAALFIHASAIRLANELKVGEACPVCGSLEHPNPRTSDEPILSKEELEARRLMLESKQQEHQLLEQKVAGIAATLKEEQRSIDELVQVLVGHQLIKEDEEISQSFIQMLMTQIQQRIQFKSQTLKEIKLKGQALEQQIDRLIRQKEEQELLEQDLKASEHQLAEQVANLSSVRRVVIEMLDAIPKPYQDYLMVKSKLHEVKQERNQLEQHIREAQSQYQLLTSEMASTKATILEVERQMTHYQSELTLAKQLFDTQLRTDFTSVEEYQLSKCSMQEIMQAEAQVKAYEQELQGVQSQLIALEQSLKDLAPVELSRIEELIRHLSDQKELLQKEMNAKDLIKAHNKDVLESIQRQYRLIQKREEEYRVIGELADLANGKSGGKMSFETYVLSSYFDDVLEAANSRLEKMTARRYYLLRREEVKGGGRKGLDLDVYDSHTCKKRPVNTLSGGESFKASLALALGLSDTVQQNSGGIQLDTMFIDEGFGTLDSESLDQAIDILMELQDYGRLIGVISHVNELKERIPAKLVVEMDSNGSRAYLKK